MTTVFLSYARGDDEPFVRQLYDDLTAAGFDVWFDRVSMPNRGLAFTDEIGRAIAARDRLILIVGPKAIESSYVQQEWSCALDHDKPVHPVVSQEQVRSLLEAELRRERTQATCREEAQHFGITRSIRTRARPERGRVTAGPPD
ncbi:MAG TPA: toll/interleukin-1 receptor domain-containing protein [Planctomycetaceae bacterium]|nr:toll/interleukin-1 receptor domain-containing protein [Planctomycetaceae bacterium]HQZ65908.1 toll/interleukin-1 receptor domain-containing protein [Planctomycetaceae bacterium]HRA86771.1 toll/interleukin-1 receptor domain-containing protein [Planctomycetaceae bacterium]